MAGEFLELYVHGIAYGLRSSVLLRDRDGREFYVGNLAPTSRTATRLVRRRHPDGQRADIAAAAAALRDSPTLFTARDLAAINPPSQIRSA